MRFSLFIVLLSISYSASAGGPWTKKKGEGYAQIGVTIITYSSLFGDRTDRIALRREVMDFTTQGYLEYGFSEKFTGVAILPFKYVKTGNDVLSSDYFNEAILFEDTLLSSGSLFGPGNIALGWKYNITNKKYWFTAELMIESGLTSYRSNSALRTGYGAWAFQPGLSFGRGWNRFYFFLESSFRLRTNNYSNEIDAGAEVGYKLPTKTWVGFRASSRYSLKDGSFDNNNNRNIHTGLTPNNQQYVGYGFKVAQEIGAHFALNFSFFSGFGELVAAAPSLNFGLSYKWEKKRKEDDQN